MVKSAIEAEHTSLAHRLDLAEENQARLEAYLAPIASGLEEEEEGCKPTTIPIKLSTYIEILESYTQSESSGSSQEGPSKYQAWFSRIAAHKKKQRAYGSKDNLQIWAAEKGWSRIRLPIT